MAGLLGGLVFVGLKHGSPASLALQPDAARVDLPVDARAQVLFQKPAKPGALAGVPMDDVCARNPARPPVAEPLEKPFGKSAAQAVQRVVELEGRAGNREVCGGGDVTLKLFRADRERRAGEMNPQIVRPILAAHHHADPSALPERLIIAVLVFTLPSLPDRIVLIAPEDSMPPHRGAIDRREDPVVERLRVFFGDILRFSPEGIQGDALLRRNSLDQTLSMLR